MKEVVSRKKMHTRGGVRIVLRRIRGDINVKEVVSRKKMHTRGRCQNSTEENKRRHKCEGGGFKEENAHKGEVSE